MGRIRVEKVSSSELPCLRELNQKIFPILTGNSINDDFYQDYTEEGGGFALFGYYTDKLAGAVCCQLEADNGLYLRFIGVLNRHRRKGVGTALMKAVHEYAESMGVYRVYMYCRGDNKAVLRLGQKYGLRLKAQPGADLQIVERLIHSHQVP